MIWILQDGAKCINSYQILMILYPFCTKSEGESNEYNNTPLWSCKNFAYEFYFECLIMPPIPEAGFIFIIYRCRFRAAFFYYKQSWLFPTFLKHFLPNCNEAANLSDFDDSNCIRKPVMRAFECIMNHENPIGMICVDNVGDIITSRKMQPWINLIPRQYANRINWFIWDFVFIICRVFN